MRGVRIDRFLASTAVALFLSAGAGGVRAEPIADGIVKAASTSPDVANVSAPTVADPDRATAAPAKSTDQDSTAKPAPAIESKDATPAPATAAPATESKDETPAAPKAAPETTGAVGEPTVATPAAADAPAAVPAANAIAEADAAVAEQLRNLPSGKFDRIIGSKKDRTIIDAFYSGRDYAPIWLTDGKANERAKAAIDYLGHVDADGLDPADYPVPNFDASSDPAALADADIKLTMSVITYAHHAKVGRVHWSRVSPDILYTETPPEPADVLANIVQSKDVAAMLASYEPQARGYLALKAKLAEIRAGKGDTAKPPIPNGPVPKVGAQDDRVPQLRDRLGISGDGTTFDKALADAVKKFQQRHELKATGTLTAATIEALNGREPSRPVDTIIANMERWRWMPRDLGKTYVMVNLPDFTLRVFHDDKQVWMTKIVDGKPAMPTPIMSAEMKFITINPTWNVPPSIVNNEYLPALQQDPTVLERMGLKVGHNPDGTVHIWQPPGDKNALGHIRFNFPNKFLVYQHDTPDKYLFAYDKRAYSHGCMRVQDPAKYAEVLLGLVRPNDGYTEERIRKMFGTNESDIQFPTFIPVHLTYQTAFVDDAGKLEFRDDMYGRDKALLALLKGSGEERKVADIAIEHKESLSHRQILAIPDQASLWGGRGQDSGGGFFSRLFGGSTADSSPPNPRKRVVQRRKETRSASTVTR